MPFWSGWSGLRRPFVVVVAVVIIAVGGVRYLAVVLVLVMGGTGSTGQ